MELAELLRQPRYSAAIRREIPELIISRSLTLDELVVLFLAEHEVKVMPVDADISPSGLTTGLISGAIGADWAAANAHLTQQKRAAALQEWTSWKQCAMGHADCPAFKQKQREKHEQAVALQQETWSKPETQQRLAELITAADQAEKDVMKNAIQMSLVMFAVVAFFAGFLVITDKLHRPANYQPSQSLEQSN
jgi:hypothetical protein